MSAPLDALHANRYFARRRRVELLRAGGLAGGVADHNFLGPNVAHTPSPALISGDVTLDATIVSRHVGYGDLAGILWVNNTASMSLTVASGTLTLTAPGFGAVASIDPAIPLTNGRHIFVVSMDIPNTRLVLEHNGTVVHDDTNAGFTSWGEAGNTYNFGASADDAVHQKLEIYLRRLSPAL